VSSPQRALLLDYGGVLTGPVTGSFTAFEEAAGIPPGRAFEVLVGASRTPGGGLIGSLERGELTTAEFDDRVVELLRDDGYEVPAGRLLDGLAAALEPSGRLWEVARQVRSQGVPTGLLSNSWGTDIYPRERLERYFDVLVISAEVGLRKPDPAIYELACDRIGLTPEDCAFVDDLPRNVEVARELGMYGVLHTGDEETVVTELADFLDVELALP
jgi:putative hydrolase of the HAD superfamily